MDNLKWSFLPSENPDLMKGSGFYIADTPRGVFSIGRYLPKNKDDYEDFYKIFMVLGHSVNTTTGGLEFKTLEEAKEYCLKVFNNDNVGR